jgi:hypothetical protein
VAAYIASEQARDLESQMGLFTNDALVHDEGRDHRRLDANTSWKRDAWAKFNYSIEILNISMRHEVSTLDVRLEGDFPGSPVELSFSFTFKNGRIASLIIP